MSVSPRSGSGAAPAVVEGVRQLPSFKLRFAARRVLGHSYVSAVRPLTLPARLTDKWWQRESGAAAAGEAALAERALPRVQALFARGPRDKHERPLLSSHEYGWWNAAAARLWAAPRGDRRLQHPIRDSAWLKARARELPTAPALPRKR